MMNQFAGNGLTLKELEQIEEAAHRCQTVEAETVLRLAAALREALQLKFNACAFCPQAQSRPDRDPDSRAGSDSHFKN